MHVKMLKDATADQMASFIKRFIFELKGRDEELYNEAEDCLYREVYGDHFTEWSLGKALECLPGKPKWTVEETTSVAMSNGMEHINEYDWNYAMNASYDMFHEVVPDTLSTYVKLAKRFYDGGRAYKLWKNS